MIAMSVQLAAQNKQDHPKHHHYKLIDLGTFGGPSSGITLEVGPLNNHGMVTSCADTSLFDLNYPNTNPDFGGDPYIQDGFLWQAGNLFNLGTLPGGTSSCGQWISDTGLIAGASTNGLLDPLLGFPEVHATLWINQKPLDLGTLGGNESQAYSVNNFGLVVGGALNEISDPYASWIGLATGGATQAHAFLWANGMMHDLHTLGTGTDSIAFTVNDRGQIDGESFINTTVEPSNAQWCNCPGLPTMHPFLWENGEMKDLGTIGGTYVDPSWCCALNDFGEVVGGMTTEGDAELHPFLWDGHSIRDLKTLGGTYAEAVGLNDSGEVVGFSNLLGDQTEDAFLWKNGTLTDLKALPGDAGSYATGINATGQIVGQSIASQGYNHEFLWENNGPMVNLQDLLVPGSEVIATEAAFINDAGEIAGNGFLPNGDRHATLAIPCDESHPNIEGCDYGMVEVAAPAQSAAPRYVPGVAPLIPQLRRINRYRLLDLTASRPE
jgi:probable HAF family extracellular repeat protein